MIFDCFTFFDELDLLELRLRTLDAVVDRFVICEAPFTFRGAAKPLYFSQARERFARWNDRITLLVYDGAINVDPWENEWGQRNFLVRGLDGADPDDLILLSDCDEIPDPKNVGVRPATKLVLGHLHKYSLGYVNRISSEPWMGTRAIAYRDVPRFRALRDLRMLQAGDIDVVNGGWHLSHLGGTEVVERKMKSYAHSEYDLPYYTDRRRLEVEFGSDLNVSYVPIDDSLPKALQEPGPWERFIWRGPVITDANESRARQHAHGCFAYVPGDAARVIAVTRDRVLWEELGRERFGSRFAGAVESLPPGLAQGSWAIIDGFERADTQTLATLGDDGVGVVAFLRNARSFVRFDDLLNGKELTRGRAIGIGELVQWAESSGRRLGAVDRLQTTDVYAPWSQMPENLGNVRLGTWLTFTVIGRDVLADFLAQAFVVRLLPQQTP